MRAPCKAGRRAGFTLAEVMATVTLIGTLGGSGAFVNPKDDAQKQVCLQHLTAIGQAFQMAELRGQPLPKACFYPKSATAPDSLATLMQGQVAAQAFLCPCAPTKLKERKITYVFNSKLGGKLLSDVADPSQTWLIADLSVVDPKLAGSHNGGACILYADGQARWVARDKMPDLKK